MQSHTQLIILIPMQLKSGIFTLLGIIGLSVYMTRPNLPVAKPQMVEVQQPEVVETIVPETKSIVQKNPAKSARMYLTIEEIAQTIREDRLCDDENNYLLKESSFPSADSRRGRLYSALYSANHSGTSRNPCLLALISSNWEEALHFTMESEDRACKFARALLLTNQLSRYGTSKPDYQQGIEILNGLERGEPDNGIYSFFKIGALGAQSGHEREMEDEILNFFRLSKIKNPLLPLMVEIREMGSLNFSAFYYGAEISAGIAVPSYQASSLIQDWIHTHPPEAAYQWSEHWVNVMNDLMSHRVTEPFVLLVEVSAMKNIAAAYYGSNGKSNPIPYVLQSSFWKALFQQIANIDKYEFMSSDTNCKTLVEKSQKVYSSYTADFRKVQKRLTDSAVF